MNNEGLAVSFIWKEGRLHGLAVACWTTDHNHLCSNLSVVISEGCFVLELASLPLMAHLAYHVHKSGRKTPIVIWKDRSTQSLGYILINNVLNPLERNKLYTSLSLLVI